MTLVQYCAMAAQMHAGMASRRHLAMPVSTVAPAQQKSKPQPALGFVCAHLRPECCGSILQLPVAVPASAGNGREATCEATLRKTRAACMLSKGRSPGIWSNFHKCAYIMD